MSDQTSFRLSGPLARALARAARARGVPKSQLVREALEQYLADEMPAHARATVQERSAPYVGAVRLDARAITADPSARMIRRRNWRE